MKMLLESWILILSHFEIVYQKAANFLESETVLRTKSNHIANNVFTKFVKKVKVKIYNYIIQVA